MPGPLEATGATRNPTRFGALGMGARQFTGLWTHRSPFRDAAVQYLIAKFYGGSRFDSILDGINREITQSMTDKRSPGSAVYNSQTFPPIRSLYSWRYVQNGAQQIRVMADCDANIFDATGPDTKLNIWNKSAGSGRTRFLGVNTELFFNDGVEPKKWLASALTWKPNTLFDGAATSDTPLGDFIIDPNGNVQQAVGGFTLLISAVEILNNVLTLTLNNSKLSDPSAAPTGTTQATGGSLPAGNWYARIAGVDANGNTTEASSESVATATTGATSQITWTWPAISGAVSYRVYIGTAPGGEATYFIANTNSFTQTIASSTMSGVPPVTNTTSVSVPDNLFQMVGVQLALSGLTAANFLNGQNITIASVLPGDFTQTGQITAAFTHADYPSATDTGQATSGSGITGGVEPDFSETLWAVTLDGGAQWINRSSALQNWGIAAPGSAPSVYPTQAPVSTTFPKWQANTFYWPSRCIFVVLGGVQQIFLLSTGGTTGTAAPAWDTSVIGAQTPDNSAVWTYVGPAAWQPGTNYAKGAYTTFQPSTGGLQVYIALNPGTSGANQGAWIGGVNANVPDGSILWQCLGTVIPYNGTGTPATYPLVQWPTIGSLSFRNSFALTPSSPNVLLYNLPGGTVMRPGGKVVVSGCANSAMDGTGTVLAVNVPLPFTGGYGIAVSIPYTGGTYHPYVDQAGGSIVYTAQSAGLTPLINVSNANIILDTNGYLEQIQDPGGFSGLSQPNPWGAQGATTQETLSATITQFEIASGIATLTADNTFGDVPGANVTVEGLSIGVYLNGTWVLVSSTPATFAIQTGHADVGPTTDSGTATIPGGALWLNIGPYAAVSTKPSTYAYSYGNSVTAHVGTASQASVPITLQAGFQATMQGFGSADPQVDTIWLWATPQGESTLIFMDKIANPGGGVPWTYTRTMPDVSNTGGPQLNPFITAPVAGANNPPLANTTAPVFHLQRVWAIVNNTVVYSDGPDVAVGSGLEAFNPQNVLPFSAQPIRLIPVTVQNGGLLVLTTDGIKIILGLGTSDNPFYATDYYSSVSVASYDAVSIFNNSIFVMESNLKVSSIAVEYPFNPQSGYTEIGFPIGDQFKKVTTGDISENLYDAASTYLAWNMADTDDTALYVADGAVGWFRMSLLNMPESGIVWSVRRAIVGGTSCVQDVEVATGTRRLLIGPAESGPILVRDTTGSVWEDNGEEYDAWDVKGVNKLCSTGQWVEVAHISTKSSAVGARPIVSVLFGEIAPSEERPYTALNLDDKSNDPALTPSSKSYYSDRYVTAQNGENSTGDCLLTKFDYGSQAFGDELHDWEIFASLHEDRREATAQPR